MFSAFPFTLARSVNQNEPAASNPRNRALQFELEQPRQQVRDGQAGPLGDLVDIAGFAGRQTREQRVPASRCEPCARAVEGAR